METSQSIAKLAKALLLFSVKSQAIKKDALNPHFRNRYASLDQILEAIKEPLSECGLVIVQMPTESNGLITTVIHAESGEFIRSVYYMNPERATPQGQGSVISYQRRYCIQAALNLSFEMDDDGNTGSGVKAAKAPENAPDNAPVPLWAGGPTEITTISNPDDKPWLEIGSDMFNKAVAKLKDGNTTINKIRNAVKVSKKVERALLEAAGITQ